MRDSKQTLRRRAAIGLGAAALALAGAALPAFAQEASTTYRGPARDPFVKYKPPVRRKATKAEPVAPPTVESRVADYKAQRQAAMRTNRPAPKPTTAFLLGELQVTGIFRTPRGYAAMVEATPISLSYVVYPGEPFYDGMLVAIEESRLVFRKQTRWSDGSVKVVVETKPLRQPSAGDALTVAKVEAAEPAKPAAEAKNDSGEALPQGAPAGTARPVSNRGGAELLTLPTEQYRALRKECGSRGFSRRPDGKVACN